MNLRGLRMPSTRVLSHTCIYLHAHMRGVTLAHAARRVPDAHVHAHLHIHARVHVFLRACARAPPRPCTPALQSVARSSRVLRVRVLVHMYMCMYAYVRVDV